jgi:hypothetical protein
MRNNLQASAVSPNEKIPRIDRCDSNQPKILGGTREWAY